MSIALVTFIYPNALKYVPNFIRNIEEQDQKDFTLIIFNDGVKNVQSFFKSVKFPFKVVEVNGTPTQVRFKAFEWLKYSEFEKIIFQDIDDLMSNNRLKCLSELLDKYDLVANDLNLIDDNEIAYAESVWGKRLGDMFIFDYNFISDKNIVGIGNSAIRKKLLSIPILYSDTPLVADWFMYYQILFNSKKQAVFTNRCKTFYRQHENNMAGLKELTYTRLNYVFKVKEHNYKALEEVGIDVANEKRNLQIQRNEFNRLLNREKKTNHFFWWEETLS